nr:hypothetical protein [Paraburkholderia caribensis]
MNETTQQAIVQLAQYARQWRRRVRRRAHEGTQAFIEGKPQSVAAHATSDRRRGMMAMTIAAFSTFL